MLSVNNILRYITKLRQIFNGIKIGMLDLEEIHSRLTLKDKI